MITDFPEVKRKIKKVLDTLLKQKVKQSAPVYSMVNKVTLHEGDKLGVFHADGNHKITEMRYIESQFTILDKEIPTLDSDKIVEKVSKAAEDMAGQLERGLFKTLDETMKETGNIIPGNPELGPESILTALEMVSIDFEDDDRNKPVKPSIIAAPAAAKKLIELEAKTTPEEKKEYQRREDEILDRKYKEYMSDLESRTIID